MGLRPGVSLGSGPGSSFYVTHLEIITFLVLEMSCQSSESLKQTKTNNQCCFRRKEHYCIWCRHLLFCLHDCTYLDFFLPHSACSDCDTQPFLIFFLPVLPSPLPASPFLPSVSGTRSMIGSRAWLSVCTGTWGRSRTTSARRTRSSETQGIFKGLLQSLKDSFVLVLAQPCSMPFCLLSIGLTKLHSNIHVLK